MLINRESLQLPGDKTALLARRHIQDVGEKLIGITLQCIGYGDEGVQFRRFESAFDITDILGRQIHHLCKFRLSEPAGLPHFLNPSAHFLSIHTNPPYSQ